MSDFFQNGDVTTLHRLGSSDLEQLEAKLVRMVRQRPVALVLPALYSEFEGEALPGIIKELKKVKYLKQIIVTLGRANEAEFEKAKLAFQGLDAEVRVIWNSGKRIEELYNMLGREGVSAGNDGKGRSAWMAYGYVLASEKSDVIALHDCDILTYNRELLARLCYPVVSTNLDFEFCKGYYSRVTDKMHGRVTRLFVTPLIRSLINILGSIDFLIYLDSFRYPLAGEFSMTADLVRRNRIPGDWGLEVGMLSEVYRNCSRKRVCQVDLCDNYEHKHQSLSKEHVDKGLMKMSIDIAQTIFRTMASMGVQLPESLFKTLKATYLRTAQDFLLKYTHDADINGLSYDRHEDAMAIEAFMEAVVIAGDKYLEDPMGAPAIPNWNRATSAIPDFFEKLVDAVEKDNGGK
ncbi:MAG: glycosyl transferase [bacterium]|nr:glycosyl transferase [bacterium]